MWYANQITFVAVLIQAIGLLMIAGLMLSIAHAVLGRYLIYWSVAWGSFSLGLFCRSIYLVEGSQWVFLLIISCVAQYFFGFMLWAGCRNVVENERLLLSRFVAMIPLSIFAVVGPLAISDINYFFPFHAVIMGSLMTLAFVTVSRMIPAHINEPSIGCWTIRLSILALAFVFWFYAAVYGYHFFIGERDLPAYLNYRMLYEVLFELALAFGMVILGTDRMRGELEEKNRLLAEAAKEQSLVARLDSLTGLSNRRAFEELLINRSLAPSFGSIAVIDLNNLKPLNDVYGHAAGDVALKLLARALQFHFRTSDPMFRVGGDEFVVVMLGCSSTDLCNRLTKLEKYLHRQRLPGVHDPHDVSVAWGVADYTHHTELSAAHHTADQAMYEHKRLRKAKTNEVTLRFQA